MMEQNLEHSSPEPWVLLYTTNTVWEAEIVRGYLLSRGINGVVLPQVDSSRGFTVGLLAIAKVFVPSSQLLQAEQELAEYLAGTSSKTL